jgi:hypothetical protein
MDFPFDRSGVRIPPWQSPPGSPDRPINHEYRATPLITTRRERWNPGRAPLTARDQTDWPDGTTHPGTGRAGRFRSPGRPIGPLGKVMLAGDFALGQGIGVTVPQIPT